MIERLPSVDGQRREAPFNEAAKSGGLFAGQYPIRFGNHKSGRSNRFSRGQDETDDFALRLVCPQMHVALKIDVANIQMEWQV
jgi:hypothetical protein